MEPQDLNPWEVLLEHWEEIFQQSIPILQEVQFLTTISTALRYPARKKENKTIVSLIALKSEDDNKFLVQSGWSCMAIEKLLVEGNINKISFGFNAQTNNSYKNNFEIKWKELLRTP